MKGSTIYGRASFHRERDVRSDTRKREREREVRSDTRKKEVERMRCKIRYEEEGVIGERETETETDRQTDRDRDTEREREM